MLTLPAPSRGGGEAVGWVRRPFGAVATRLRSVGGGAGPQSVFDRQDAPCVKPSGMRVMVARSCGTSPHDRSGEPGRVDQRSQPRVEAALRSWSPSRGEPDICHWPLALILRVSRQTDLRRPVQRQDSDTAALDPAGEKRGLGDTGLSDAIIPGQQSYLRLRSIPTNLVHEELGLVTGHSHRVDTGRTSPTA